MATQEELMTALRNADNAGDTEAAKRIAAMIQGSQVDSQEPEMTTEQRLQASQSNINAFKRDELVERTLEDKSAGTALEKMSQGATFGFSDEIAGGGGAFLNMLGAIKEDMSIGDSYKLFRDISRARDESFTDENPKTAIAAEVAGGLATGGLGVSKGVGNILKQKALKAVAKGTGAGAVGGATYGAGSSDADLTKGEYGDLAMDTLEGGAIGGITGGLLSGGGKLIAHQKTKNQALKTALENGDQNSKAVQYVLKGDKAVKSKPLQKAISQGFDKTFVSMVKGASKEDKTAFRKMALIVKRGKSNRLFSEANRATDVVGDNIAKRYKVVADARNKAGSRLDKVASRLKGQEVDGSAIFQKYTNELRDKFRVNTSQVDGVNSPDFNLSSFENVGNVQTVIKNVFNRVNKINPNDAFELHELKKMISKDLNFEKGVTGIDGEFQTFLKGFRKDINGLLGESFPNYKKVNTIYSETTEAIKGFDKAVGRSIADLDTNNEKAIGQVMRRLTSNAQSRVGLGNVVDELERVAVNNGGKFKDSIRAQVSFADELERVFKTAGNNSFQGQISNATNTAADALQRNAVANVLEGVKSIGSRIGGVTEESQLNALRAIISTK